MELKQAFEVLRDNLGSHKEAANYLGMTCQHYSMLRNKRVHMPQRTADLIILKADILKASNTIPAPKEPVSV